ncbi:UDP binding domain-containing protein [Rhodococcus sp. CC-R104]|uniref:UDP binding domain-containing protein n=1 Tax=Rhodococcus chondri TaxID=3065941 RepID=A0ABU7JSR4_9NOCA|nr:UDP binding domain-containing protein [Rhodococcus sp. CC-R104]
MTGSPCGSLHGVRIALLGLTFKSGTSDLRDSPALAVASELKKAGAVLCGYDPALSPGAESPLCGLDLAEDPYRAAQGADALVVLTEWPQFATLDWSRLGDAVRCRTIVDTRNVVDEKSVAVQGFTLHGNGFEASGREGR